MNKRIKIIIMSLWVGSCLLALSGCSRQAELKELSSSAAGEMKVTYIDVGQGDATLIQADGAVMLIDTGQLENQEMLLNQLQSEGVENIDYFILTHPDADHIGSGKVIFDQ